MSPKQTEQYESMKADMSKYLNQYLKEGSKFSDSELQTIYKNLESFTSGFGGPSQKMLEKMMREIENSKHTSTFSKDDLMSNISDSAKAAKSINDGFTNFTVNQIVKNIQENKLTDDSD
ncbi:MAG TPA: hypothetical protein DCZ95_01965 [Verrucomicrobia bacterium]|nr:hypothetical protein [Verrucomicrobiota bacterium]